MKADGDDFLLTRVRVKLLQKAGEPEDNKKISYELETMSSKDALKFPLVGSGFLLSLYIVFKFLPKEWVSIALNAYLLIFGMASLLASFRPLYTKAYSLISKDSAPLPVWKVSIPILMPGTKSASKESAFPAPKANINRCFVSSLNTEPTEVTYLDGLNAAVCVSLCIWYMLSKNWIANNIIAWGFTVQAIALVSVGSYKIGCGLLSGLFFYDIFWVFGTDVMVTVAKSFDGPIKVVWPKDLFAEKYAFSMLGLGDIVIPGLFLALMLRYDVSRSAAAGKSLSSPYFTTGFLFYILGLVVTMFVMHVFRAAQPALLYLVPACLISSFGTAVVLGDVPGLWNYSEAPAEEETKEKKD